MGKLYFLSMRYYYSLDNLDDLIGELYFKYILQYSRRIRAGPMQQMNQNKPLAKG